MATTTSVPVVVKTTASTVISHGSASIAGYGTAVSAFAVALLAYLTGDKSAQNTNSLVIAGIGMVALGVTQIGRYVQANTVLKKGLSTVEGVVDPVLKTDPSLLATIEGTVRKVVSEEVAKIKPGEVQTISTDALNDLLPTADEEAAAQPDGSPVPVVAGV